VIDQAIDEYIVVFLNPEDTLILSLLDIGRCFEVAALILPRVKYLQRKTRVEGEVR
jgi:hypothetical protein